jgi:plastocyanin
MIKSIMLIIFISQFVFLPVLPAFTPEAHAQNITAPFGGINSPGSGGPGGGLFGGGGGLLGGLASMLSGENGLFLIILLMSLFQGLGGGSTPQQGTAEEQYSQYPGIGPTQTGSRGSGSGSGSGSGGTSISNPFAATEQSVFVMRNESDAVKTYPSTFSLKKGDRITVFNTDEELDYNISFKRTGADGVTTTQEIKKGEAHIFKFDTPGTYQMCATVGESEETCSGTITVSQ